MECGLRRLLIKRFVHDYDIFLLKRDIKHTITKIKLAYLSSGRQNYQLPELKVCQKAKIDASVYIMEIISTPGMKAFMTVRGGKITLLRCFSRK
ncbi:hypothetical protein MAR_013454 [Mya arenaria]|uniref:Uncharacterized protein n=1 Tax=Mya arenaria TaxID=6604 RepID=A0ABY7G0J6_MYAAR|nr:hypothetical protein MAR_013454 [Mya arenaria]